MVQQPGNPHAFDAGAERFAAALSELPDGLDRLLLEQVKEFGSRPALRAFVRHRCMAVPCIEYADCRDRVDMQWWDILANHPLVSLDASRPLRPRAAAAAAAAKQGAEEGDADALFRLPKGALERLVGRPAQRLRRLNLSYQHLSDLAPTTFEPFGNLRVLNLQHARVTPDPSVLLHAVARLPALEELNLAGCFPHPTEVAPAVRLPASLVRLDLRDNALTVDTLKGLLSDSGSSLEVPCARRRATVASEAVVCSPPRACRPTAGACGLPQFLDLSGMALPSWGRPGLRSVLHGLRRLRVLGLNRVALGMNWLVNELAGTPDLLPALGVLGVADCAAVSTLEALRAQRPHLLIACNTSLLGNVIGLQFFGASALEHAAASSAVALPGASSPADQLVAQMNARHAAGLPAHAMVHAWWAVQTAPGGTLADPSDRQVLEAWARDVANAVARHEERARLLAGVWNGAVDAAVQILLHPDGAQSTVRWLVASSGNDSVKEVGLTAAWAPSALGWLCGQNRGTALAVLMSLFVDGHPPLLVHRRPGPPGGTWVAAAHTSFGPSGSGAAVALQPSLAKALVPLLIDILDESGSTLAAPHAAALLSVLRALDPAQLTPYSRGLCRAVLQFAIKRTCVPILAPRERPRGPSLSPLLTAPSVPRPRRLRCPAAKDRPSRGPRSPRSSPCRSCRRRMLRYAARVCPAPRAVAATDAREPAARCCTMTAQLLGHGDGMRSLLRLFFQNGNHTKEALQLWAIINNVTRDSQDNCDGCVDAPNQRATAGPPCSRDRLRTSPWSRPRAGSWWAAGG